MEENLELPKVEIAGNTQPMANTQPKASPLSNYYRQPKIYVSLPSNGEFYPEGSLDKSEDGKYAVYSMTAKDELMLKTPDALMNGQSTVDVIQSCIPAIKNAWNLPSLDLDACLVAIRVATYGEKMDIDTNCPKCNEELRFEKDLADWLGTVANYRYPTVIQHGELVFHIEPLSYRQVTKAGLMKIEQEKIWNIVNSTELTDEEKLDQFGISFTKLTKFTVDGIVKLVRKIDTPHGSEENRDEIEKFITQGPKEMFDALNEKLTSVKDDLALTLKGAKCSKCENVFDVGITMDQADFFVARS